MRWKHVLSWKKKCTPEIMYMMSRDIPCCIEKSDLLSREYTIGLSIGLSFNDVRLKFFSNNVSCSSDTDVLSWNYIFEG